MDINDVLGSLFNGQAQNQPVPTGVDQTAAVLGAMLPKPVDPLQLGQVAASVPDQLDIQKKLADTEKTQFATQMAAQQANRGMYDLAADYPFLAVGAPGYPRGKSTITTDAQGHVTNSMTPPSQADIDKFMAQLKQGRQADYLGGLAGPNGSGLDVLAKLYGLQKTQQEVSDAAPSTVINGARQSFQYNSIPANSTDAGLAHALKNMTPEDKKSVGLIESNISPGLNAAQNLINQATTTGVPKTIRDPGWESWNSNVARLTPVIQQMMMNGQGRMSPQVLEMMNDIKGNPNGWQSKWLRSPEQVQAVLQDFQNGLMDTANAAYPKELGGFNFDKLKTQTQDPGLQQTIEARHTYLDPKSTVSIQYTNPQGKVEAYDKIARSDLPKLNAQAQKEGGKLVIQPSSSAILKSGLDPISAGAQLGQVYDSIFGNKDPNKSTSPVPLTVPGQSDFPTLADIENRLETKLPDLIKGYLHTDEGANHMATGAMPPPPSSTTLNPTELQSLLNFTKSQVNKLPGDQSSLISQTIKDMFLNGK